MTASAPQCQPRLTSARQDEPTAEELAAWADEAQACVDSGEIIISDHRKARATIDALRSHASLKARVEELEAALREVRIYVADDALAAGTPAYVKCCQALIEIDAALQSSTPAVSR